MSRPALGVQEHNIRVKKGALVPKFRNSQVTDKGEVYCYTSRTKTESRNSRVNQKLPKLDKDKRYPKLPNLINKRKRTRINGQFNTSASVLFTNGQSYLQYYTLNLVVVRTHIRIKYYEFGS